MLRSIKEIQGITLHAKDGEIGKIYDFYFDDSLWKVRYIVAETGSWLTGRKVLLTPVVVGSPNWFHENIPVDLTIEQIKNSPDTDLAKPISRQYESKLHDYFQWAPYWLNESPGAAPVASLPAQEKKRSLETLQQKQKVNENTFNLRSTREIIGYYVHSKNGEAGHVEDFFVDDETWQIKYLLVDMRNWLPGGKKVLVALHWVEKIDWVLSNVHLALSKEVIENSPDFDSEKISESVLA